MKLTTLFASEHLTFVQIRSSDNRSVLNLHLRNRMVGITLTDTYDAAANAAFRRKATPLVQPEKPKCNISTETIAEIERSLGLL